MSGSSGVAKKVALLASLSVLTAVRASTLDYSSGLSNYTFPDDFMFGVSTAAFQIEGAWNVSDKGESMWDTYLHQHPEFTPDRSNGDVAADSYHKWREDINMIQELGVKYYRMSISWPRVANRFLDGPFQIAIKDSKDDNLKPYSNRLLPQGTDNYISKDGTRYYRRLFEELQKANITVLVTLFHWDMPTPLMDLGGWSNPKIVDYFEDYARVAFTLFGDIIKIWTTLNEPHQHCYNGYGKKYFVPALNSHGTGEYLCSHYMLLAHSRVYHLYDKEFRDQQKGKIGITLDAFWAEPKDINKPEDHEAAERYLQMHLGLYAHPIFSTTGDYPALVRQTVDSMSLHQGYTRSRLPYFSDEEVDALRGSSDFFGLNHYTTFLMSPINIDATWSVPSVDHDTGVLLEQDPTWPRPGSDWFTINPVGFRKVLNWVTKNYGKEIPVIITENGMCDFGGIQDYERVSYFNDYLYQLLLAMYQDDCNVQGYFAWTLMDDFEWSDGYVSKFGLYHVDFNSSDRTRTPKLSAINYREIVRTNQINFDFIKPPKKSPQTNNL